MEKIIYTTVYHGGSYGKEGEAGPETKDPWKLAEITLEGNDQCLTATAPDGTWKRYKFIGSTTRRLIAIEKTTSSIFD
tara:strand:+ start:143 stop:376 length:234 start_codon:yes stop_codon:yes gene_type:complete